MYIYFFKCPFFYSLICYTVIFFPYFFMLLRVGHIYPVSPFLQIFPVSGFSYFASTLIFQNISLAFFIIFADRYFNLLSYIHQLNCLHSFSLILCRLFLPSLLSLLPSYIFVFPSLVASFIFFHLFFLLLLNFISPFFFVFIHIILSSFLTLLLLKIFQLTLHLFLPLRLISDSFRIYFI